MRKSAKKQKVALVVARQSPAAGRQLPSGRAVNVTLAPKQKRHKHRR